MLAVLRGADASIGAAADRHGSVDDTGGRTPLPRLSDLPALVDAVRQTGRTVAFSTLGEPPPLPASVEMIVYRLVQEGPDQRGALRRRRTHRRPVDLLPDRHHRVRGRRRPRRAAAGAPATARSGGSGHGLVGMQERLAAIGGTLEAGPRRPGPGLAGARQHPGRAHQRGLTGPATGAGRPSSRLGCQPAGPSPPLRPAARGTCCRPPCDGRR